MNRRNLVALLAVTAFFLGWKTYRAWTEDMAAAVAPPAAREIQGLEDPPGADSPAQDFTAAVAAIVARPVFRADRKPFRPEDAAAAPGRNYEAELSRYMLLGVVLQMDARKAVVVTRGNAKAERWDLSTGDSIAGFVVKEIEPDGITLSADGKEFLLPLFAGAPKTPAQGSLPTAGTPASAPAPRAVSAPPRTMPGVRPPQTVVAPPGAAGQGIRR